VLTNALPPCQVKEQDDDHNKQVNNIYKIKKGVLNELIPSAVADSRATSSVRTKRDRNRKAFAPTGQKSDKAFCMPNGKVEEASNMDELHHGVHHLQTMYTLCQELNMTPSSASQSLLTQTMLRFLTKTKSTSMTPTKQSSPSLAAQYSVGDDVNRPSSGAYPSPRFLKMKTPAQSSAIDAQQNSSQTSHHQSKQSTMCTS
jgi:hypothetical protein